MNQQEVEGKSSRTATNSPLHIQLHLVQILFAHRRVLVVGIPRQILQQRSVPRRLIAVLPLGNLVDRRSDSELIQQLVESVLGSQRKTRS
jgi:hypothetical protein